MALLYFSRNLLPSASSGYIQSDVCPVVDFCLRDPNLIVPFRYNRLPSDFVAFSSVASLVALLWGAVGAILLTCDHHMVLFLFAVSCTGCMFTHFVLGLIHSGLSSSMILVFWCRYRSDSCRLIRALS